MPLPVPEKNCLPKPCPGRDQRCIPFFESAGVKDLKVPLFQHKNTIGIGDKIVNHFDLVKAQNSLKRSFMDHPGEIGRLAPAADDRPGDAEGGRVGGDGPVLQELRADLLQIVEPPAGEARLLPHDERGGRTGPLEEPQIHLGPADVTRQDDHARGVIWF